MGLLALYIAVCGLQVCMGSLPIVYTTIVLGEVLFSCLLLYLLQRCLLQRCQGWSAATGGFLV